MGCLDDRELPVRCQAALALQPLLRHEYVINAMKPQIPQIMQRLLGLINEVDADMLSMVMEEFVEQFSTELTPFAVDLALNLVCVTTTKTNVSAIHSCVLCRKTKRSMLKMKKMRQSHQKFFLHWEFCIPSAL